jgi:hypothetical protein
MQYVFGLMLVCLFLNPVELISQYNRNFSIPVYVESQIGLGVLPASDTNRIGGTFSGIKLPGAGS